MEEAMNFESEFHFNFLDLKLKSQKKSVVNIKKNI